MTEATAAHFTLAIVSLMYISYIVRLLICLRQARKELNDLKSRMAKPGDVSRLIEQCERDLAKGEVFVPSVPECWKPHKAHDIVREMENNAKNQFISDCMNQTQSSATYFGGGDFGGSGAGDSYGSSDGGGSND